jgi:hypothetical protein
MGASDQLKRTTRQENGEAVFELLESARAPSIANAGWSSGERGQMANASRIVYIREVPVKEITPPQVACGR